MDVTPNTNVIGKTIQKRMEDFKSIYLGNKNNDDETNNDTALATDIAYSMRIKA